MGPIVFVGLVVPHLARYVAGWHTAIVIPLTVALGAEALREVIYHVHAKDTMLSQPVQAVT